MVVVVVVTVLVSTHSATACILDIASPSSHPIETVWLVRGRRVSVPPCEGFVVDAKGLGEPSAACLTCSGPEVSIAASSLCVISLNLEEFRSTALPLLTLNASSTRKPQNACGPNYTFTTAIILCSNDISRYQPGSVRSRVGRVMVVPSVSYEEAVRRRGSSVDKVLVTHDSIVGFRSWRAEVRGEQRTGLRGDNFTLCTSGGARRRFARGERLKYRPEVERGLCGGCSDRE